MMSGLTSRKAAASYRMLLTFGLVLALGVCAAHLSAQSAPAAQAIKTSTPPPKAYPDPKRYEKDISAFEAQDRVTSPPTGAIVCIGSSSMRGWHKTIHQDLAPLTIIARGFGGSTMNDAIYYANRMVIAYKPRAVVVYEGDNDIAAGIPAEKLRDGFATFVNKVRAALPDVRIYYMSTKPSPSRLAKWPETQRANELIRQYCEKGKDLTYIDVATPMLDNTKAPRLDIFLKDRLHMNPKGYEIWTKAVKPVLMAKEMQYEKAAAKEKK